MPSVSERAFHDDHQTLGDRIRSEGYVGVQITENEGGTWTVRFLTPSNLYPYEGTAESPEAAYKEALSLGPTLIADKLVIDRSAEEANIV